MDDCLGVQNGDAIEQAAVKGLSKCLRKDIKV